MRVCVCEHAWVRVHMHVCLCFEPHCGNIVLLILLNRLFNKVIIQIFDNGQGSLCPQSVDNVFYSFMFLWE